MTHRAVLYEVSVRPVSRRAAPPPLGDVDGHGTSLLDALARHLDGFAESSADGSRVVRTLSTAVEGDDLFAILRHGRSGVAADIVDPAGTVRLRQRPDDLQLVRSGCLFRLPPAATRGLLAVHVGNGRGMKGLLERGLAARFRTEFPRLALAIERPAGRGILRQALAGGGVEKVRLSRVEPPGAHPAAGAGKWVGAGVAARVELDVGAGPAGGRVDSALVRRYVDGDQAALDEIVRFAGLVFDRAKVGVVLPDGTRRLLDVARPDAGPPVTYVLPDIALDADGEPTPDSLLRGLRVVVTDAPASPLRAVD